MWKVDNTGNITVETTMVMGIYLLIIIGVLYVCFYLCDYTVAGTRAASIASGYDTEENNIDIQLLGRIKNIDVKDTNQIKTVDMIMEYYFPVVGEKYKHIILKRKGRDIGLIRRMKVMSDGISGYAN